MHCPAGGAYCDPIRGPPPAHHDPRGSATMHRDERSWHENESLRTCARGSEGGCASACARQHARQGCRATPPGLQRALNSHQARCVRGAWAHAPGAASLGLQALGPQRARGSAATRTTPAPAARRARAPSRPPARPRARRAQPHLLEARRDLGLVVRAARPGRRLAGGSAGKVHKVGACQRAAPAAARERVCAKVVGLAVACKGGGGWAAHAAGRRRNRRQRGAQRALRGRRAAAPRRRRRTFVVYGTADRGSSAPPRLSFAWPAPCCSATNSEKAGTARAAAPNSSCAAFTAAAGRAAPASGAFVCSISSISVARKCCIGGFTDL